MPTVSGFLDTNVLLYAVSRDPSEAGKTAHAAQLLAQPGWGLSLQVVQEFFYNATVKLERPMSRDEATRFLEPVFRLPLAPVTLELFRQACRISGRHQIRTGMPRSSAPRRSLEQRPFIRKTWRTGRNTTECG